MNRSRAGAGARVGAAVLGATGAVGQRFIERLQDHPTFEVRSLVASDAKAGKPYPEACTWLLDSALSDKMAATKVESLAQLVQRKDVRVVFSALPGGVAGPIESQLAAAGFAVFTNARDHRMNEEVPLLIPEVNPEHIRLVDKRKGQGFIVANGNCSAIILTLALTPLHRAYGLDEVHVTTLQGLSGAGYPGVPSLDVIDNVVPYIGGEEDKLAKEPQRTLGVLANGHVEHAKFPLWATATRVPVREGHLESVHLRLARPASEPDLLRLWTEFRGPAEIRGLPSAPDPPIKVLAGKDRPQPRRDRDLGDGMAVSVGRVRLDPDGRRLRFVVLGHNTVRGAAGQSVLNAEYAHKLGYL